MRKIFRLLIPSLLLTGCTSITSAIDDLLHPLGFDEQINNHDNKIKINEEFLIKDHACDFDSSSDIGTKFWVRNGYKNDKDVFLSTWNRNNVTFGNDNKNSVLEMSLTDVKKNNYTIPYGSEIVSYQGYLYGYFGVRMKTFKREGTVQSFFTYNAPTSSHPEYEWDEIDIEFLGKDTTKVQFNYYDNGVGNHEFMYDLGFDSSTSYHDYGFVWRENQITWFVDFEPVYQVKASLNQWGFYMMNVWGGNPNNETALNWLGKYESSDEKYTAKYDYVIASEFSK